MEILTRRTKYLLWIIKKRYKKNIFTISSIVKRKKKKKKKKNLFTHIFFLFISISLILLLYWLRKFHILSLHVVGLVATKRVLSTIYYPLPIIGLRILNTIGFPKSWSWPLRSLFITDLKLKTLESNSVLHPKKKVKNS